MIKIKYSKGVFLNIFSKDKRDWKKQINFINSLRNVNHVEILLEENLTAAELKFLKSMLKKYDIIIHAPFVHLSLISPHREIRDITINLYLKTLKIAEKFGAKCVTFHCGTRTKFSLKKSAIELLIKNFKKIKERYKGKIVFTIENLPAEERGVQVHYPTFLNNFIYLKRRLSWLDFTLDIGHAFQNGEKMNKITKFLKKYQDSILDIHLHDATLRGEAHLALGKGDLNIKEFFNLLNKINYNKFITLETVKDDDTKKSWEKISKL